MKYKIITIPLPHPVTSAIAECAAANIYDSAARVKILQRLTTYKTLYLTNEGLERDSLALQINDRHTLSYAQVLRDNLYRRHLTGSLYIRMMSRLNEHQWATYLYCFFELHSIPDSKKATLEPIVTDLFSYSCQVLGIQAQIERTEA